MPPVSQIAPSFGCGITAYGPEPGTMRLSLLASACWFGSTYSSSLPLPLTSSTNGAQPTAFCGSPVSSNTRVLTQPATGPVPLSHSVLSLSKPNCGWCVPKQVSTNEYFIVLGSSTATWRVDFSIVEAFAYALCEPLLHQAGLSMPRTVAAIHTRPFSSNIALCMFARVSHSFLLPQ